MHETHTSSTPTERSWTVLSLIEWSANHLRTQGFDEARLHVELLLAHVLNCQRLQLYTQFDRPLNSDELGAFKALYKRRLTHEPLQYILGKTEFMGVTLQVDPRVLIPRPETELLVELAVQKLKSLEREAVEVLDVGTGSGNIPIALAKFIPNARILSIDVSKEALDVARCNIEHTQALNIALEETDILQSVPSGGPYDMIISNPPYISREEHQMLDAEVRDYEPRKATTDEGDGYTFIRRLAEFSGEKLRPGGFLLMEIAYNQSARSMEIAQKSGLTDVVVHPDYAGHPRILSAQR